MKNDNETTRSTGVAAGQSPRSGPRLVPSACAPITPRAKARWTTSSIACPQRVRLVTPGPRVSHEEQRRRIDRQEGKNMERKEGFISNLGRFAVGLGIGLALTSAYVIVTSGADLLTGKPAAADIVRLDPVEVTISAERFAAIQAEAEPSTKTVHVYGAGPKAV